MGRNGWTAEAQEEERCCTLVFLAGAGGWADTLLIQRSGGSQEEERRGTRRDLWEIAHVFRSLSNRAFLERPPNHLFQNDSRHSPSPVRFFLTAPVT